MVTPGVAISLAIGATLGVTLFAMTHPLAAFREKYGVSRDQLAKRASTTRQTIFRVENGQTPSIGLVARLIAATEGRLRADDFMPSTDAPSGTETASHSPAEAAQ